MHELACAHQAGVQKVSYVYVKSWGIKVFLIWDACHCECSTCHSCV